MTASALNNAEAPDTYTDASTVSCPGTVRVRLQVNNAAIYWQRGESAPGGGGVLWKTEELLLPCLDSLEERCDAIRIRAAVPLASIPAGKAQARVTIATRTEWELPE